MTIGRVLWGAMFKLVELGVFRRLEAVVRKLKCSYVIEAINTVKQYVEANHEKIIDCH